MATDTVATVGGVSGTFASTTRVTSASADGDDTGRCQWRPRRRLTFHRHRTLCGLIVADGGAVKGFTTLSLRRPNVWLAASLAALLLSSSPRTHAFSEDACLSEGLGWQQCFMQPCPAGGEQTCELIAFATLTAMQVGQDRTGTLGARSTLHFDATYYLAQAVGFSARDAYAIAAYDAASDTEQFVYRTQAGALVADPAECGGRKAPAACRFNSQVVHGVWRNNFTGGGLFFHFPAPPTQAVTLDGMAPVLTDPIGEPFLYHTRRWVYGLGPLCVGGLTNVTEAGDTASGDQCFVSTVRPDSTLVGRIPFVTEMEYLGSVDWIASLGEQKIVTDPRTGADMPASHLEQYLGPEVAPLAALGLYMHALQDRISHYRCQDASVGEGPRALDAGSMLLNPIPFTIYNTLQNTPTGLEILAQIEQRTTITSNPDFLFQFDTDECDQLAHAQRHTWETGVDQETVAPESQTARPALLATYDELLQFAQFHLLQDMPPDAAAQREAVVDAVVDALEATTPVARFRALCGFAALRGYLPLPTYCRLPVEVWEAKAGSAMFASPSSNAGAASGSGGRR